MTGPGMPGGAGAYNTAKAQMQAEQAALTAEAERRDVAEEAARRDESLSATPGQDGGARAISDELVLLALSYCESRGWAPPLPHIARLVVAAVAPDLVRAERDRVMREIQERADEVGETEEWWVGGAWGDYGEVVVPLRAVHYVVDGVDHDPVEPGPDFAATYAEAKAAAELADGERDEIRDRVRRECAEDLRALSSRLQVGPVTDLTLLADRWSTPDPGEPE